MQQSPRGQLNWLRPVFSRVSVKFKITILVIAPPDHLSLLDQRRALVTVKIHDNPYCSSHYPSDAPTEQQPMGGPHFAQRQGPESCTASKGGDAAIAHEIATVIAGLNKRCKCLQPFGGGSAREREHDAEPVYPSI